MILFWEPAGHYALPAQVWDWRAGVQGVRTPYGPVLALHRLPTVVVMRRRVTLIPMRRSTPHA